jgi:hypothetical protein
MSLLLLLDSEDEAPNVSLVGFQVMPYTYHARALPDVQTLRNVPGTAPGKMDVMVGTASAGEPWAWAALGWSRKPLADNYIFSGDFAKGIAGWGWLVGTPPENGNIGTIPFAVNRPTAITWGSIGLIPPTPNPEYPEGAAFMGIEFPSSLFNEYGNQFRIYRRFRKGQTYTFSLLFSSSSKNVGLKLYLGVEGNAGEVTHSGTSTPTVITGTWTPTSDTDVAVLALALFREGLESQKNTVKIGQISVYEGTVPPKLATQVNGRGAAPPFGVLQAEGSDLSHSSNVLFSTGLVVTAGSITAGSVPSEGTGFMYSGGSTSGHLNGGGESQLAWWIDPSLMVTPDDYARGSMAIEVLWRGPVSGSMNGSSYILNPRLLLWALPEPALTGEGNRFTAEYGTVGHSLVQQLGETGEWNRSKLARLGTLDIPVNPQNPVRWLLVLTSLWSNAVNGLFGTDSLLLLPAARRATLPTGKSATDGTYPLFQPITNQHPQKVIKSDLRGQDRVVLPGGLSNPSDAGGMTGTPMDELPCNPLATTTDLAVVTTISNLVPDDPSGLPGATVAPEGTVHFAITPRYRLARGQ